jgi:hypothetical protein
MPDAGVKNSPICSAGSGSAPAGSKNHTTSPLYENIRAKYPNCSQMGMSDGRVI